VKAIAKDIKTIEEKLLHHGKTSRCNSKRHAATFKSKYRKKRITDFNAFGMNISD
jgi:hypothetical protein